MVNLKFFKGAFTTETNYEDGGIYFDNTSHEIRVGKGAKNSYDAFGSAVKDATCVNNILKISFSDGRDDIVLDFSDVASAEALAALKARVDTIEANYVAKETGKSLIEDTKIAKLDGIEAGAEVNKIAKIKVNDVEQTITNKTVNITVPEGASYSIAKDATSGDYAAVYHLTKDGVNVGTAINIPKDMVVRKAGVVNYDGVSTKVIVDGEEVDVQGSHDPGKYVIMLIQNSTSQVWLSTSDLVRVYTGGETDSITVSISDTNVITATLKDGTVGESKLDSALRAKIGGKVDSTVSGLAGTARIFNESDGGGAKFENGDGTWSYVGVNDGGGSGIAAQIYAVDSNSAGYRGAKIDVTKGGIYYTTGDESVKSASDRDVAANEIVTRKDLPGEASIDVRGTVKYDGSTIKKNADGQLYVDVAVVSTVSVSAGDGINVVQDGKDYKVSVKYDNDTIKKDNNGKLYADHAKNMLWEFYNV